MGIFIPPRIGLLPPTLLHTLHRHGQMRAEGEKNRNDSLLTRRVCGQLKGGKGAPRAHDGLYEPLGAFWAWMCMQKLVGPKAPCAESHRSVANEEGWVM